MSSFTACERLELIRHKDRPTVNDYIPAMFTRFMEFHGDRLYGDDAAIIGGIGYLCKVNGELPKENAWIMLTAKVESGFSALHNRDGINLIAQNITPAKPPKEELVYLQPM